MLTFLDRLSTADVPVLIMGETGVGKEVLARAIHARSSRASAPFLKLNCAALPSELIESELFGYERGAFTGAFKSTRGKFELADGGTILLDEIGDMDLKLQAKLLQVLQDSQFLRIGGVEEISVNVRVIAATHHDLPLAVRLGRFRQDLYYRLNVVKVTVPPLRERVDEILPLTEGFLRRYSQQDEPLPEMPPVLIRALLQYSWPGNIRELENQIRRFIVLRQPDILAEELTNNWEDSTMETSSADVSQRPDKTYSSGAASEVGANQQDEVINWLPEPIAFEARPLVPSDSLRPDANILDKVDEQHRHAEAEAILRVLNGTLWNRKQAAEVLKVDYKALLYKMKKLGLSRDGIANRTTLPYPRSGTR